MWPGQVDGGQDMKDRQRTRPEGGVVDTASACEQRIEQGMGALKEHGEQGRRGGHRTPTQGMSVNASGRYAQVYRGKEIRQETLLMNW